MTQKPNIIVILTDDLGYGDVSCMDANSKIKTKHIDKLAAEGMRLTDCHSSSALCTPSRYALLTGRYNWRSRLKAAVLPGQSYHLIETGRETIPILLKKQGYRTAAVGKWHLGMDWVTKNEYTQPATYWDKTADSDLTMDGIDFTQPITNGPNDVGFDYFYGMPASLDQPPFIHIENNRAITQPVEMRGVRGLARHSAEQQFEIEYGPAEADFDPRRIVPEMDEKVLGLVDSYADDGQPFFLYYPTFAVHGQLVPDKEHQRKSGLNAYGDFVLQVDDFVGKLDELLQKKGIADNTIVLLTSDNGCSAVADFPALLAQGHNPSSVYRGLKGDVWEGGHRIPFVVRWPAHIQPNSICSTTSCLVDLFATFAEITGASYGDDAGEDSFSMLPLWQGESSYDRNELVHHSGQGNFSLRKGDWKIEYCQSAGGMVPETNDPEKPPYQLYNLAADVAEHWNLYGSQAEIEQEMLQITKNIITSGRSTPGEPQKNVESPFWPGLEFMKEENTD